MNVSVADAKNRLPELIRMVEGGEQVVIIGHGRAVAQISAPPAERRKPVLGGMKGRLDLGDPRAWRLEVLVQLAARPLAARPEHVGAVCGLPPLHKDPFGQMSIAQATVEGPMPVSRDAEIARYSSSSLRSAFRSIPRSCRVFGAISFASDACSSRFCPKSTPFPSSEKPSKTRSLPAAFCAGGPGQASDSWPFRAAHDQRCSIGQDMRSESRRSR